ncbi:MAG: ABC transporter ATP-binding protein [Candidatus Helarchaeota archaeon]|nr:ABC transporter ATP-binding protein [Candidatus Helarchaeota archaeon]
MQIQIKDVSFAYNCIQALDNVNFIANHGEILGLIGPNGSGKTTLLRCINRVLKPKIGAILINGDDISNFERREIAMKMGVVPQYSKTFPFTVLDTILMGRFPHINRLGGETVDDLKAVKHAMELTGTLPLAERLIDELSGGELQKVILARALAQTPEVLLLDEPTTHLDVNHQLEMLELIKKITKAKGLITIMVSHNLNLAARYCDKLLLLNSGQVYSIGSVSETLTAQKIRDVFHVDVEITYHNSTQSYNIILLSPAL